MKVYFISGLGADSRVFRHLQLPSPHQPVYLDWITPQQDESLSHYAIRLAQGIDTTEKFGLVGLSFGGMLAIEIAKKFKPEVLVLISSVSCTQQLPFYYKLAGKLRLHKLLPVSLFLHASVLKRIFTTETSEDKKILREMIRNCDHKFVKWAFHAVLTWDHGLPTVPCIHIHGSRDGILPCRFTQPTHIIKKGGHLMVLNRPREINRVLSDVFSRIDLAGA